MRRNFYKIFALTILLAAVSGCKQKHTPLIDYAPAKAYSEAELRIYLDSLGQLSDFDMGKGLATNSYAIGDRIEDFNIELSEEEISMFYTALKTNFLDTALRKKIPLPHDEKYTEGKYTFVTVYSFDERPEDMDHFAFTFGKPLDYESDWYFFKSKKLIAKHHIDHSADLDMKHFKDYDGKVVVYYTVSVKGGTGFSHAELQFFKYDQDVLIPILTEVKRSGLGGMPDYDYKGIETEVVKNRPLTIKFKYDRIHEYNSFNSDGPIPQTLIQDSTLVTYYWKNACKCMVGDYRKSKLNEAQLRAFNMSEGDDFFIHAHYQTLKNHLDGSDSMKKIAVLLMLEHNARWNDQHGSNHD